MNYFSKNKKWMAYLILLTFLFTSVMPTNLGSMNSIAEAASGEFLTAVPTGMKEISMAIKGQSTNSHFSVSRGWISEDGNLYVEFCSDESINKILANNTKTPYYFAVGNFEAGEKGNKKAIAIPKANWFVIDNIPRFIINVGNVLDDVLAGNIPVQSTSNADGYSLEGVSLYVTSIYVVKQWEDDYNRDGIRPNNVTVQLYEDNEKVGNPVQLSDSNEWRYIWSMYTENTTNEYEVKEVEVPSGYEATITNVDNAYTITNTHTPEETEATVKKVWDDANDQDGKRPVNVIVQLTADGEAVGNTVALNAENNWTVTKTGLPKYKAGKVINYSWTEADVEGYTLTDTAKDGTLVTLTNRHKPEKTEATVKKVWDDADDQDGKRPESLTVTLSNGTTVTLNEGNKWTATVKDLPKYANGQEISYTWTEGSMPEGYTLTGTAKEGTVTTLTNSYTPETTEATVKKVWDDADNQDGKRPVELKVTLSNGTEVTLNAANSWTAKVTDLPKYKAGNVIEYTWTEGSMPKGYALTDTKVEGNVTTLTNSYTPELTEVTVKKVWDDADNQDGKRPAELNVTLSNGTEVTLNETNNWTATVSNLPKYANGQLIVYAWEEPKVDGYVQSGMSTGDGVTTFTNTHTPETTKVTVKKVWDDASNQDGKRPAELNVTLSNGTEVTLNAANNWTATVENLPKYEAGNVINYTWIEGDMPEGYALTGTSVEGTVTTLTNSYEPEVTTATVKKVWNDANNQDGKRPAELNVTLSNGTEVTLNAANNWTATVENLPVYANGEVIEYTWAEGKMPEGYELTATSVNGVITTLTNSYTPETVEKTVKKVWDDANNQDGKRPVELKATLSNGTEVNLNAANGWQATVSNLPKYENGKVIVYTWAEAAVTDYKQTGMSAEAGLTTFTNTHVPETTEATVKKVWNDADNQDGKRPAELNVTLSNGIKVTLNAANNWTATVENLPVYEAGKAIEYTWTEADVEGYELTNTATEGTITTLTNTHTPEETEATVKKVWDDADNQDGIRPAELTVTLSNGTEVTLNAANNWTATVEDLPVYKAGQKITYTWTEGEMPEGYTLSGTATEGTVTTLTNTHEVDTISVSGEKTWNDDNNRDGVRPSSITVKLLADGEVVDSKVVTGEGNTWNYKFENLPKYAAGVEIEYTITEDAVDYYSVSVDGYNITNTHEVATTEISGEKFWDDNDNAANARPFSITVNLFADGEKVASANVTSTTWKYEFTNLPIYRDGGQSIIYQVVEDVTTAPGYVPAYSVEQVNGAYVINIINTYSGEDAEYLAISGTKTWNDNNNELGKRPASINVNLLRDGDVIESQTVTADDNWAYEFTNLPKADEAGNAYVYTVTEDAVAEYRSVITKTSAGFDIINTLITGEAGQIQVSKVVTGAKAPVDGVFGFTLHIEASAPDWDAIDVYNKLQLEKAYKAAKDAYDKAKDAWDAAVAEFAGNARALNTTGSAIEFVMKDELNTTASGYQYLMIDEDARITSTTSSSYYFDSSQVSKVDTSEGSIFNQVVDAIYNLAADFSKANSVFLKALGEAVTTTPSALGFEQDDAQNLLNKADTLFEAKVLMDSTSSSVLEFENSPDVTSASAITLIVKDAAGNEVDRQDMFNEQGKYDYLFNLKNGQMYTFEVQTTTGSSIEYFISETQWVTTNYVGTTVTMNGTDVTDSGVRYSGVHELTTDAVYDFVFTNIYEDTPPSGGGDYTPPYTPPVNPPKDPEEVIDDPEVPLDKPEIPEEQVVVPGEELEDPEIPLGDAPATGDTTQAVPFVALMLIALAGLFITRKKFN